MSATLARRLDRAEAAVGDTGGCDVCRGAYTIYTVWPDREPTATLQRCHQCHRELPPPPAGFTISWPTEGAFR
jgi:hypothetical protein